ncbi:MAG: hypothetical protein HC814_04100 [Rhodobacteraceae bacterium]|nr:hypothetical protein [Paracoccaceae bacterium]
MFDGEGAAVGNQHGTRAQEAGGTQPVTLLVDGSVAVVIAVQALTEDGDGTPFIDDGRDADLKEFFVGTIAVRDVRGGTSPPAVGGQAKLSARGWEDS